MAYATKGDLVPQRMSIGDLAELTSEEVDGGVDDAVVQGALDEATGIVNAYCGQRYKTPLQASELVKKITVDLAIYGLFSRRRDTKITETISQAREMAMSFLRDISSGKASLDQPTPEDAPQQSTAGVTVTCTPQVFNDDNLRGFC